MTVFIDAPRSGRENMGIDTRLLDEHQPGDTPILRVYRWAPAAVSSGYHQPESDFDHEAIAARGYDLVRRPTGGRAILHAEELTYAVIGSSPSDLFGDSLHDSYHTINRALLEFLRRLGIEADISEGESLVEARGAICFRSAGRHEITVDGRKLIGSAQRRRDGVFLQHGSILCGAAHVDLLNCLKPNPADRQSAEGLASVTTDLGELLGRAPAALDYDRLGETLIAAFAASLELDPMYKGICPGP